MRPATCTSAVLYRHPLAHAVHPNLVCGKLTQSFQDHSFGAPHSRVALCVTSFRWVGIPSDRTRTTFSPLRRIVPRATVRRLCFAVLPHCSTVSTRTRLVCSSKPRKVPSREYLVFSNNQTSTRACWRASVANNCSGTIRLSRAAFGIYVHHLSWLQACNQGILPAFRGLLGSI